MRPGVGTVMDDAMFDRLARGFDMSRNRRWLLALIGATIGMLGQRAARASQLGPATCGDQGAVCRLLFGCCDGLICATSATNTSYGICVPGEGGMVSIGPGLISPFSETAEDEVAALVETAPTSDPRAEREARIAEIRARKDAKSSKRETRLDEKRTTQQTRKDEQRDRRLAAREAEETALEEALGPQLQLELLFSEADGDSEVDGDQMVPIDVVRATNRDDVDLVLTRIETIQGVINGADLTTFQFTLSPGESYLLVSGLPTEDVADAANGQYRWLNKIACDGTVAGQGYRVKAAFSRNAQNHQFAVFCDGPHVTSVVETPAVEPPPKRKKNDDKKRKRNDQRRKKKR